MRARRPPDRPPFRRGDPRRFLLLHLEERRRHRRQAAPAAGPSTGSTGCARSASSSSSGPARAANPHVRMIIKYPNWYEHFQGLGYDLDREPHMFDAIYTGTETRDPEVTDQLLQQYESYEIIRYFDNIAPGRQRRRLGRHLFAPARSTAMPSSSGTRSSPSAPEIMLFNWTAMADPRRRPARATAPAGRRGAPASTGTRSAVPWHGALPARAGAAPPAPRSTAPMRCSASWAARSASPATSPRKARARISCTIISAISASRSNCRRASRPMPRPCC